MKTNKEARFLTAPLEVEGTVDLSVVVVCPNQTPKKL